MTDKIVYFNKNTIMLSIDRAQEILNNREYADIVSKEQLEAIKASEMTILYGTKNQSIRYI